MQNFFRLNCLLILGSFLIPSLSQADDWPQWRGPNRDGVWNEKGIVKKFEKKQLEIRWRKPLGPGYSGPTVADGRVFVTDRLVEKAQVGPKQANPKQFERIHCFDAKSGIPIWSHKYPAPYSIGYPAGPRASVTVDDGRAFALGAMGHLHCLDAGTGRVLWKKDLNVAYKIQGTTRETNRMPIWGISAAPLVYKKLLILHIGGSNNACIVALNKKSGREAWRALPDRAQYSTPILIQQAGKTVLVCWTGDSITGLNPDSGEKHWRYPFPQRIPIGVATPVVDGDKLFMTSYYDGSLMLRLKQDKLAVEKMWWKKGPSAQQSKALHSSINTPMFLDDHLYGIDSFGHLRCLKSSTGERVWSDVTATPIGNCSTAHFVRHGKQVWIFNELGELLITQLSPNGFAEISRAKLIEPTETQYRRRGRGVCWSHPAFADKHVFARNDKEIVCASLKE